MSLKKLDARARSLLKLREAIRTLEELDHIDRHKRKVVMIDPKNRCLSCANLDNSIYVPPSCKIIGTYDYILFSQYYKKNSCTLKKPCPHYKPALLL